MNDQKAYDHYVALCIANGLEPWSFEGWQALTNGEIPEDV
jgi:hypothetical protein